MLEVILQSVIEHVDQTTLNAQRFVLQKSICSKAITSHSLQPALTYTSHLGASLNTNAVPWLAVGRVNLQVCLVAGWVNRINHQPWCCFCLEMHFIYFIFRCSSKRSLCRCSRRLAKAEGALNSFAWTYNTVIYTTTLQKQKLPQKENLRVRLKGVYGQQMLQFYK